MDSAPTYSDGPGCQDLLLRTAMHSLETVWLGFFGLHAPFKKADSSPTPSSSSFFALETSPSALSYIKVTPKSCSIQSTC